MSHCYFLLEIRTSFRKEDNKVCLSGDGKMAIQKVPTEARLQGQRKCQKRHLPVRKASAVLDMLLWEWPYLDRNLCLTLPGKAATKHKVENLSHPQILQALTSKHLLIAWNQIRGIPWPFQ